MSIPFLPCKVKIFLYNSDIGYIIVNIAVARFRGDFIMNMVEKLEQLMKEISE